MSNQNQITTNKLNDEEGIESELDHVYGTSVRFIQEKYTYNLKDAASEIRNKQPNKKSGPSDTIILNPRDLKHSNRYAKLFIFFSISLLI